MSLFSLCPWWQAQCADVSPNYDSQLLHCCRFGLGANEKDYIVVGSHTGHLSIYKPIPVAAVSNDSQQDTEFEIAPTATTRSRATDLLMEIKMPHPIIGILSGRFLSNKDNADAQQTQLALLHPMKVSVYGVHVVDGVAEHGAQTTLDLCFEHKFQRFAFSFCKGHFGGGVKTREFLCIVHGNSSLSFYEQDGIAYGCQLPGAISSDPMAVGERSIPSILRYVPRIDSFVTVSAACELECFRYQDLAHEGMNSNGTKRSTMEASWTCCVGEFALDITVHQISNDESAIMILGENNLLSISDVGKLRFIKRLDYTPICFHSFVIGWFWEPNCRLLTAVVSDRGSVMLYEESRLLWSLQLSAAELPVAISRANFTGLSGALVVLGETGQLTVGYLGSEPHPFRVPALNLQELNFERAQLELNELEKEIQAGVDFTEDSTVMAATSAERDLTLEVSVGHLERCKFATNFGTAKIDPTDLKQSLVTVMLRAHIKIDQIQVFIDVTEPLRCNAPIMMFRDVAIDHTERLEFWVYVATDAGPVSDIGVRAIVSFINTQSICRVLQAEVKLPLCMFFKQTQPLKDEGGTIKLTFSTDGTDQAVPSLASLLAPDFQVDQSQAIGLQSIFTLDGSSGAIVTIVAAKKSNRFRVQASTLDMLAVVMKTLLERLKECRVTVQPSIPVDEIGLIIEQHYRTLQDHLVILKNLEDRSAQMRLVQRRFFVKVDDKKSGALNGISMLFKKTHQQIFVILKELEQSKRDLSASQMKLSNALALAQLMVKHLDLATRTKDGLVALLVGPANDWLDQGWEESVNPALERLNHMGDLKSSRNAALEETPSYATLSLDIGRFRRHFVAIIERACRLAVSGGTAPVDDFTEPDNDDTIDEHAEEPLTSDWNNTQVAVSSSFT